MKVLEFSELGIDRSGVLSDRPLFRRHSLFLSGGLRADRRGLPYKAKRLAWARENCKKSVRHRLGEPREVGDKDDLACPAENADRVATSPLRASVRHTVRHTDATVSVI